MLCKSLHLGLGPQGAPAHIKTRHNKVRSINQPISSMNSSIWTIWQLWARSADSRNYSAITQSFEEILPYQQNSYLNCHRTRFHEKSTRFHEESTRFHKEFTRLYKTLQDSTLIVQGRSWQQIPIYLSVKMTPLRSSSSITIILNKLEDWE